jgi:hypothetical protein
MPGVRNLYVGKTVSYLTKTTNGPWKWTSARVSAVVNATTVKLVTHTGVALGGGANISKRTVHGQTGVWRH